MTYVLLVCAVIVFLANIGEWLHLYDWPPPVRIIASVMVVVGAVLFHLYLKARPTSFQTPDGKVKVTDQPSAGVKPASSLLLALSPSSAAPKIQPGSILIVTVTKIEAQAVLEVFSQAASKAWTRQTIGNKTYYDLGTHGGIPVYMVQSEMGTATPGGALLTVRQAIQDLRPQAVIMCGIAFGLRPDKQHLGDILIAKQLLYYEPQKVDLQRGQISRGDRITSTERLLDRFRSGDNDWQGAPTCFGLVVSGEKLVNDPAFRDWLLKTEPEAVGGEMEGGGLYVAARDAKVDWILVKAVCDWADGKKNDSTQRLAAFNAAQFVLHVLQAGSWGGPEQLQPKYMDRLGFGEILGVIGILLFMWAPPGIEELLHAFSERCAVRNQVSGDRHIVECKSFNLDGVGDQEWIVYWRQDKSEGMDNAEWLGPRFGVDVYAKLTEGGWSRIQEIPRLGMECINPLQYAIVDVLEANRDDGSLQLAVWQECGASAPNLILELYRYDGGDYMTEFYKNYSTEAQPLDEDEKWIIAIPHAEGNKLLIEHADGMYHYVYDDESRDLVGRKVSGDPGGVSSIDVRLTTDERGYLVASPSTVTLHVGDCLALLQDEPSSSPWATSLLTYEGLEFRSANLVCATQPGTTIIVQKAEQDVPLITVNIEP